MSNDGRTVDAMSPTGSITRSSVSNGGLSLTSRRVHPPPPPPPPSVSRPALTEPRVAMSYCQYHCFATDAARRRQRATSSLTHHHQHQHQQQPAATQDVQRGTTNSACSSLV